MMVDTELALYALLLVALVSMLGGWSIHRAWRRRQLRVRVAHARIAERRAIGLVRAAGFRICGYQVTGRYTFAIDGHPHHATMRADLMARRRGRRYVVEVKTGQVARPHIAATRRQLLEYRLAFGVHGVMLADLERGQLHRIEFTFARGQSYVWLAITLGLGLVLGTLIALHWTNG